jgi:pyruvate formate lyase activating enzyme
MVKGRIHSFESMGLVDGPGIRSVIFFQGCNLRCAYCHNPDTWNTDGGTETTTEELLNKVIRFKPYFQKSGGGVTFSGGEPLMQPEFLLEMLKLCRANGIHTTIDTAGYGNGDYDEILKFTDLVLLDIKHSTNLGYETLTGKDAKEFNEFLDALNRTNVRVWVRHVVVPEITDTNEHILELSKIVQRVKNLDKIELLPYHTLGESKYEKMHIPYRLKGTTPMDKARTLELEEILKSNFKQIYCKLILNKLFIVY